MVMNFVTNSNRIVFLWCKPVKEQMEHMYAIAAAKISETPQFRNLKIVRKWTWEDWKEGNWTSSNYTYTYTRQA